VNVTTEEPGPVRAEPSRIEGVRALPPSCPPDRSPARRPLQLKALLLDHHVLKVLADAPPFTEEQRNHIAALLHSGGGIPLPRRRGTPTAAHSADLRDGEATEE